MFLHCLPRLFCQLDLPVDAAADQAAHIGISAVILALPGLLAWGTDSASSLAGSWGRQGSQQAALSRPFLEQGYAYVPLVWAATLAFYLKPLLGEAGRILQVS